MKQSLDNFNDQSYLYLKVICFLNQGGGRTGEVGGPGRWGNGCVWNWGCGRIGEVIEPGRWWNREDGGTGENWEIQK